MSFNDFVQKHKLKIKAKSNKKKEQLLSFLSLQEVGIYLRDGPFESEIGIVNIHPSKGAQWVLYKNEFFFIHMVVLLPRNYLALLKNEMYIVLFSEYKIQGLTSKRDSYCASFCLFLFYLTKVIELNFKKLFWIYIIKIFLYINDITEKNGWQ